MGEGLLVPLVSLSVDTRAVVIPNMPHIDLSRF